MVLVVSCGCQGPQPGPGGQIDPYTDTYTDRRSDDANVPDLLRFGDRAAERLAYEISQIPEIRDSPTRVVIEFGTLANRTDTPTGDFEMLQRRLRNALQSSTHVQNYAMFVESRARMQRETDIVMGEDKPDLLQEGTGQSGPARYEATDTYVLQGDFHETRRGNVRYYYFAFQLTNLGTRATVFNWSTEPAYLGQGPLGHGR